MIAAQHIWETIQGHVPRKQWVPLEDIFAIVEQHGGLDEEDRHPQSPGSKLPKWKAVVRNVLVERQKLGSVRRRERSK